MAKHYVTLGYHTTWNIVDEIIRDKSINVLYNILNLQTYIGLGYIFLNIKMSMNMLNCSK